MLRIAYIVFFALLVAPCISDAETIEVNIKGVDDGVRFNKQQDYKEAVMNAKLQAIERAGVEIESITKVVNFQVKFDMVESKSKGILMPGFNVIDIGYTEDGSYQIVLSGKVQVGEKQNALFRRENDFKGLLVKGTEAFEANKLEEALDLVKRALDIPGFENNSDAEYLLKQVSESLMAEARKAQEEARIKQEKEARLKKQLETRRSTPIKIIDFDINRAEHEMRHNLTHRWNIMFIDHYNTRHQIVVEVTAINSFIQGNYPIWKLTVDGQTLSKNMKGHGHWMAGKTFRIDPVILRIPRIADPKIDGLRRPILYRTDYGIPSAFK